MLRDPVVITPAHSVRQVMALSEQLGISGFPVVDAGKVVGIVPPDTPRDLLGMMMAGVSHEEAVAVARAADEGRGE